MGFHLVTLPCNIMYHSPGLGINQKKKFIHKLFIVLISYKEAGEVPPSSLIDVIGGL